MEPGPAAGSSTGAAGREPFEARKRLPGGRTRDRYGMSSGTLAEQLPTSACGANYVAGVRVSREKGALAGRARRRFSDRRVREFGGGPDGLRGIPRRPPRRPSATRWRSRRSACIRGRSTARSSCAAPDLGRVRQYRPWKRKPRCRRGADRTRPARLSARARLRRRGLADRFGGAIRRIDDAAPGSTRASDTASLRRATAPSSGKRDSSASSFASSTEEGSEGRVPGGDGNGPRRARREGRPVREAQASRSSDLRGSRSSQSRSSGGDRRLTGLR